MRPLFFISSTGQKLSSLPFLDALAEGVIIHNTPIRQIYGLPIGGAL